MGKYDANKTKLCKHCQTEIPLKAKVCPNCRRRVKGGKLKWILLIAVIAVLISSFSNKQSRTQKKHEDLDLEVQETIVAYTEATAASMQEPEDFLELPETQNTDETSVQEPTTEERQQDVVNNAGIRPEFQEAMDAYEDFYNEYCDFLEKYYKNPSDLKLLAKYGEMLIKVEKMDSTFEEWNSEEMNDEELKYYLDVNNRVMKRLLDANSAMSK